MIADEQRHRDKPRVTDVRGRGNPERDNVHRLRRHGGTIHALGANQREHALRLAEVKTTLANVQTEMAAFRQESRATFRSVDEQHAEIKDLITGRRHVSRPPAAQPPFESLCAAYKFHHINASQ